MRQATSRLCGLVEGRKCGERQQGSWRVKDERVEEKWRRGCWCRELLSFVVLRVRSASVLDSVQQVLERETDLFGEGWKR